MIDLVDQCIPFRGYFGAHFHYKNTTKHNQEVFPITHSKRKIEPSVSVAALRQIRPGVIVGNGLRLSLVEDLYSVRVELAGTARLYKTCLCILSEG